MKSLKTEGEVKDSIRNGEFKLNCNMAWLAFVIRYGHLTADREPDFKICSRPHRKHELFIV